VPMPSVHIEVAAVPRHDFTPVFVSHFLSRAPPFRV
jgi:hypothetical protein